MILWLFTVSVIGISMGTRRFGYEVGTRGQVAKARCILVHGQSKGTGGPRGSVTEWSRRSRARMCVNVASQEWSEQGVRLFVTLTFAGLEPDGKVELRRLHERVRRRFGKCRAVWWREFQARGAAHFHLLIEFAPGQAAFAQRWLPGAWKSCGGGICDVRLWSGETRDLYRYALKEALAESKSYQHVLPVAVESAGAGRWWGCWEGRGGWRWVRMSQADFCELRRRARRAGVSSAVLGGRRIGSFSIVGPVGLVRGLGVP